MNQNCCTLLCNVNTNNSRKITAQQTKLVSKKTLFILDLQRCIRISEWMKNGKDIIIAYSHGEKDTDPYNLSTMEMGSLWSSKTYL